METIYAHPWWTTVWLVIGSLMLTIIMDGIIQMIHGHRPDKVEIPDASGALNKDEMVICKKCAKPVAADVAFYNGGWWCKECWDSKGR